MVRISRAFINSISVPIRQKDEVSRGFANTLKPGRGRGILNRFFLTFLRPHYTSAISFAPSLTLLQGHRPVRAEEAGLFSEMQLYNMRTASLGPQRRVQSASLGRIFANAEVTLPETLNLSAEELKAMLSLTDKDQFVSFLFKLSARDFRPFIHNLSTREAEAIFKSLSITTLEALLNEKKGSPAEVAVIYRKILETHTGKIRLGILSDRTLLIIFDALRSEKLTLLQAIGFDRQVSLFPSLGFKQHQAYFDAMTDTGNTDRNALKDIFFRQDPYHQYDFYHSLSESGKRAIRSYGYKPDFSRFDRTLIKIKFSFLSLLRAIGKFCYIIR
ncbi:MAG: hypothetical protein WC890_03080 [Candidatus Margulisiibacteriota bacterium]